MHLTLVSFAKESVKTIVLKFHSLQSIFLTLYLLTTECSGTLTSIEEFTTTFSRYKQRLAVVRENKLRMQQEEDAGDFNDMGGDLYSDTSSIGGSAMGSVSSYGSSSSAYSTSTTNSKMSGLVLFTFLHYIVL